jgi:choline kinase
MQAVILLAGYGSRLNLPGLPHKVFLKFGDETLLSRHLKILEKLGISKTFLVVGHSATAVSYEVVKMGLKMPVEFINNELYMTTGNTLSLVMGLRYITEDVLVLDGDVLYPQSMLKEFVQQSAASSFAVIPADIDNAECAKTLLGDDGTIQSLVTKRLLTDDEKSRLKFVGEAIGFIKMSVDAAGKLVALYEANEDRFIKTLWEDIYTELAPQVELYPHQISQAGCYEIDTQEDYEESLKYFNAHRAEY